MIQYSTFLILLAALGLMLSPIHGQDNRPIQSLHDKRKQFEKELSELAKSQQALLQLKKQLLANANAIQEKLRLLEKEKQQIASKMNRLERDKNDVDLSIQMRVSELKSLFEKTTNFRFKHLSGAHLKDLENDAAKFCGVIELTPEPSQLSQGLDFKEISSGEVDDDGNLILFNESGHWFRLKLHLYDTTLLGCEKVGDGSIKNNHDLRKRMESVAWLDSTKEEILIGLDSKEVGDIALITTRSLRPNGLEPQSVNCPGVKHFKRYAADNGIEALTQLGNNKFIAISEIQQNTEDSPTTSTQYSSRILWKFTRKADGTLDVSGLTTYDFANCFSKKPKTNDVYLVGGMTTWGDKVIVLHKRWYGFDVDTNGMTTNQQVKTKCEFQLAFIKISDILDSTKWPIKATKMFGATSQSARDGKHKTVICNTEVVIAFKHRKNDYVALVSDNNQRNNDQRTLLTVYQLRTPAQKNQPANDN